MKPTTAPITALMGNELLLPEEEAEFIGATVVEGAEVQLRSEVYVGAALCKGYVLLQTVKGEQIASVTLVAAALWYSEETLQVLMA